MDRADYLDRTRRRGVNPLLYWLVRAVIQPFFHLYFRMSRVGREHVPQEGPVIIAANHRSFLDPFVIGTLVRRPVYFVAKQELFRRPLVAWFLNSLGAFPIDRGNADGDAMATAREILERGGVVAIFPEGTRIRPGALGRPKRGVGRLALETGAPVVPVAVIGTEAIRTGWRIRPHKVRLRVGRPLRFPRVEQPSPELARAVTERIWPCVALQWEWLGGLAPVRRAVVIGAGAWGTTLAVALARAGVDVTLGCRTADQAERLRRAGRNESRLPSVELPPGVAVASAGELELTGQDLVCLAVPARDLPAVMAAHGSRIPQRAGVLVASRGLVAPSGALPSTFVAERCGARAVASLGGPARAPEALERGGSLVVACADRGFARQLGELLRGAQLDATETDDVTGVELAGAAADAAALAAGLAATHGAEAAGAAAGKVFAEVGALAAARGAQAATFGGLAGVGELVAGVLDAPRHRSGDAFDAVALLAGQLRDGGIEAPATEALAELVEGRLEPEHWADRISAPRRPRAKVA
jgi:glycerol-3-phosphate dehydrogenase (NAD(P)+)